MDIEPHSGRVIMCNSKHADSATVWFNVHDSQSGASLKALIDKSFQFSLALYPICPACANPGVPQCQCCWCWGHSTRFCKAQVPCCPQCNSPHTKANHHAFTSCCKGNLNANPPVKPTTPG